MCLHKQPVLQSSHVDMRTHRSSCGRCTSFQTLLVRNSESRPCSFSHGWMGFPPRAALAYPGAQSRWRYPASRAFLAVAAATLGYPPCTDLVMTCQPNQQDQAHPPCA